MNLKKHLILCAVAAFMLIRPDASQAGAMWRAFFDDNLAGIPGDTIDELLAASDFDRFGGPFLPELLEEHFSNISSDGFNSDDGIDLFGSITHGYIQAPMDGEYVIVIASDDNSELYLGEDHQIFPFRDAARLIGFESAWTNGDIWTAAGLSERSSTVTLEKGEIYFIEVLHKEGTGGSFITVAWQRPDGVREIIPGAAMFPYGSSADHMNEATTLEITAQPQDAEVVEKRKAVFSATVFGPQPMTFQWLENGSPLDGETLAWLELRPEIADSGRSFSLRVTDANGTTMTTSAATLTVTSDSVPPTVLGARGSGYPKGVIVSYSEPVDEASATDASNYSFSGQELEIMGARLLNETQVLLEVGEYENAPLTLSISNVRDLSSSGNSVPANSQATVAARSSLHSYWSFDEGDGTTTRDTAGGHSGELLDGAGWSTDVPSLGARSNPAALDVDGTDGYVLTTYPGVAGPRQRTVAFWMKSTDTSTHGIVTWGDSSRNQTKYHVRIEPTTGSIRTEVQGGNNWATQPVNDGVWHHVVSLVPDLESPNNSDVVHYVDGVLDPQLGGGAQGINTDISAANSLPVMVGARRQGSATAAIQPYAGLIDDLAIYDVALTDEQIAALATGEHPSTFAVPTTGPLTAVSLPGDVTAFELGSVTFDVEVSGSDPGSIGYQWFREDEPIEGANGASYSINVLELSDDGAVFNVQAFNLDGTYNNVVSDPFTLTVLSDFDPPEIVSVSGRSGGINQVVVVFNERVDAASATDVGNYSIDGLTVTGAALGADEMTVTLSTSEQVTGAEYSITVNGVYDLVSADNAIAEASADFVSSVSYVDQVLADNPDAYWRLGESGGTEAMNAVTSGWIGTYNSGTSGALPVLGTDGLVPNTRDKAVQFVAAEGNRILVPDNAALNTGGPYEDKTIELWFRADTLPTLDEATGLPNRMVLFEQGGLTRGLSVEIVGTETADPQTAELRFHAWNDNADGAGAPWGGPESEGKLPIFTSSVIEAGQTYHLAAVMDGEADEFAFPPFLGTLSHYVNGELSGGPVAGVGLFYNAGDDAGIGAVNQNTITQQDNLTAGFDSPFDGVIDEFAYYNTALSADRIAAHYETGLLPTEEPEPGETVSLSILLDGDQATISWDPNTGTLQSASSVTGPWSDEQGQSPVAQKADGNRFYRVSLP